VGEMQPLFLQLSEHSAEERKWACERKQLISGHSYCG